MSTAGTQLPWRQMIATDRLHPGPDNPREKPGNLDELRASIRASGLKHRILVMPALDIGDGDYRIEDGWRRYLAMKEEWASFPVEIRPLLPGENVHTRSILTGLVTSVHQRPLDPVEKARAYGRLRDEFGMTQAQIGAQVGLDGTTISDHLLLLELSEDTQQLVRKGLLSVGKAKQLVKRRRAAVRRKKGGSGQSGAVWEPDWFTARHPLARKAAALCDERGHNSRRRYGRGAGSFRGYCGECIESLIRADERLVTARTAEAAAAWHALQGAPGSELRTGVDGNQAAPARVE